MKKKNLVDTFLQLVQIDSPSGNEQEMSKFVAEYLINLGFDVQIDDKGNIIAKNNISGAPVLLGAHLDTVEPGQNIRPAVDGEYIHSDGATILGADNKVAVASILEAARVKQTKAIEIIFSVREETDGGISDLDFSKLESKEGLIADSVSPIGTIIEAAPWMEDINIEIIGKAAHASQPEEAINALTAASSAVSSYNWGHTTKDTITNIGKISGGNVTNTIPDYVELSGEVRSFSKNDFEKVRLELENHFKKLIQEYRVKVEVEHKFYCNGYIHNRNSDIVKRVLDIYKVFDIKPNFISSYGASDASTYIENGIDVVNIGDGVIGAHTTSEAIKVSDLGLLYSIFERYITVC